MGNKDLPNYSDVHAFDHTGTFLMTTGVLDWNGKPNNGLRTPCLPHSGVLILSNRQWIVIKITYEKNNLLTYHNNTELLRL